MIYHLVNKGRGTRYEAEASLFMQRNSGCRITEDLVYKQYRAVMLENEKIQILLLLDRGGEPVRWLHKPTDTDLIWSTRVGLQPPHTLYSDFQMSYPGGWQELMPEVCKSHIYRRVLVQRGETALNPWNLHIVRDERTGICIRLTHRLRSLPLYIEKEISLQSGETTVRIEETVRNEAPVDMETNWGHHLAYGFPFLSSESRVFFSPGTVVIHPKTGKQWAWPYAEQAESGIDLSRLPSAGTARDLLAVKTVDGMYRIDNPHKGPSLEVRWDHRVWPYVWYWQNFAAGQDGPYFSCEYNIGLEIFNVMPNVTLTDAVANGQALRLGPLGILRAWLELEIKE